MQRITDHSIADLFDVAATRRIEQAVASGLPPHTLMRRAGLSVARLAAALAPHARTIWIACGPGNNGGDGFEAALQLRQRGYAPIVTFSGDEARLPPDAADALQRARAANVRFAEGPPESFDLVIDALLGIGSTRAPQDEMAQWLDHMDRAGGIRLSVDVPSNLNADTGVAHAPPVSHSTRHCLSLLTLKPGLFTAQGRDCAGEIWFDDLQCSPGDEHAVARLAGPVSLARRAYASHKGSYGDVCVVGGAQGMAGAALLAASAALHAGAGRVFVGMLDAHYPLHDISQPELMFRPVATLDLAGSTVVCGCGGGTDIRTQLPRVLSMAHLAVLDADALNAIAQDRGLQTQLAARNRRGWQTVMTPHPLEAARLLGVDTAQVQGDRLGAARLLVERFSSVVVLKGSGSIVAGPANLAVINLTGNARLATAGTGDVLAGMIGAALASGQDAFEAARSAVWRHGRLADTWPANQPLTAGALAQAASS